jgi:hypothetical protein
VTEHGVTAGTALRGEVLDVDFDGDTVTVRLDDGSERTFAFQAFDGGDVYREGQRFEMTIGDSGQPASVRSMEEGSGSRVSVSGYVESVDQDDELVWVYIRSEEGWQRKVMPLELFRENDLARPGRHFLLELDETGTPLTLAADDVELEMLPQAIEETKPRWATRPSAEAEPDGA